MNANPQEELNSLYAHRFSSRSRLQEICGDPQLAEEFANALDGPFLVAVTDEYLAARPRIVVIGQETYGWVGPYSKFLSKGNLASSIAEYLQFDFGLKQGGSIFWRKVAEIRSELLGPSSSPQSMMWLNLFKFDHNRGEKAMIGSPFMQAALAFQGDIVAEELQILDPECVIFLTGPDYDDALKLTIPDAELRSVEDHPINELAQVVGSHLPTCSFRTYHPNYLRYGKAAYTVPMIVEKIKSQTLGT